MDNVLAEKNKGCLLLSRLSSKSLTSYHLLLTTKKNEDNEKGNLENDFADFCKHCDRSADDSEHHLVHGV